MIQQNEMSDKFSNTGNTQDHGVLHPIASQDGDPNLTDSRLLVNRRRIYERRLPGDAYISAHVERLQHGYFSSSVISEADIDYVDFLAVNFVFHPPDCKSHRFKAATIKASIEHHPGDLLSKDGYPPCLRENPRFLMYAPHLIYGAVSPETFQWNLSLSSSLGVSNSPATALLSPSGGLKGQYKLYEMMKIQGSLRTLDNPQDPDYHVSDGQIVWSLTENSLQQSGLPREFTFVMLIQKPHFSSRLKFSLEIEPVINAWFGNYPSWWLALRQYQPLIKRSINFRHDIGQKFEPIQSSRGFNFATLASSLDDYVIMPGSTYSSKISPDGVVDDRTTSGMGGRTGHGSGSQNTVPRSSTSRYSNQKVSAAVNPLGELPFAAEHIRYMGQALASSNFSSSMLNIRVLVENRHSPLSAFQAEKHSRSSPAPAVRKRTIRRTPSREELKKRTTRSGHEREENPVTMDILHNTASSISRKPSPCANANIRRYSYRHV